MTDPDVPYLEGDVEDRLTEHMANDSVRTTLEVWPGTFHVWHHFAAILPEGREAVATAAEVLARAYA